MRFLWRPRALDLVVASLDLRDQSPDCATLHIGGPSPGRADALRALWLTVHAEDLEPVLRELPRAFPAVRLELPRRHRAVRLELPRRHRAVRLELPRRHRAEPSERAPPADTASALATTSSPGAKRRRLVTVRSSVSTYLHGVLVAEAGARPPAGAETSEPVVVRVVEGLNRYRVIGPRALDILSHALCPTDAFLADVGDSDPALRMLRAMASTEHAAAGQGSALPAELHLDVCERFACAVRDLISLCVNRCFGKLYISFLTFTLEFFLFIYFLSFSKSSGLRLSPRGLQPQAKLLSRSC